MDEYMYVLQRSIQKTIFVSIIGGEGKVNDFKTFECKRIFTSYFNN